MEIKKYFTNYKYGEAVLAPSGKSGAYDEKAVDCPFVFYHNNQYYMLHVGFDGKGYQTALAVSHDLIHWEYETMIFKRGEQEGWDKVGIAGMCILKEDDINKVPKLKKVNGKYWMIYHSYPEVGYEKGAAQIGLAYTEDESLHVWERVEYPILSWQDGNEWEKGGLYKGYFLEHEGKYYMYYNAKECDVWQWHEQIGLAVSDDLFHWKRVFAEPIIKNTPDEWDSCFCADPYILKDGNKWIMYYYGYDGEYAQEGIAFSEDLMNWEKQKEPIICHGEHGEIDEIHAHKPCVITKDGILYHFYCAVRHVKEEDIAVNTDPTKEGTGATEYRCITVATDVPIKDKD